MCKERLALSILAVAAFFAPYELLAGEGHPDSKVRSFQAILNGRVFPQKTLELSFVPGRPNLLELRPDWDVLKCGEVKAVVKKTLPDGTTDKVEANIKRPGKSFLTLGPMTASAVYEFEAGVVYQRGYRLEIMLLDVSSGQHIENVAFYQGLSADAVTPERLIDYEGARIREFKLQRMTISAISAERLILGDKERVVFNPMYGVEQALMLQLSDKVLVDPNEVTAMCRLTPGVCAKLYHQPLDCQLEATANDGKQVINKKITLSRPGEWTAVPINVGSWPQGDYDIRLHPILDGKVWREGPHIIYRRHIGDRDTVQVSHLAPWRLARDRQREDIEITDFRQACTKWASRLPEGWTFEKSDTAVALVGPRGRTPQPISLNFGVKGWYAVYAKPYNDGCLIQIDEKGLARPIRSQRLGQPVKLEAQVPVFVCAADLTDSNIKIFAFDKWNSPTSGIAYLRLVPVSKVSAHSFYEETSRPPKPLYGVNDWCDCFHGPCRLAADQFDTLVGGQAEIGMRTIDWSVGRSWVEYHSDLPGVTPFPCVPLEEAAKRFGGAQEYHGRAVMVNKFKPLESVYTNRRRFGAEIWPWLAMNRHYGQAYGAIFASKFFRDNPQWRRWRRWSKDTTTPEGSAVCYFFPEVRQERIDILVEVARKGADGLLVGCCRQVPMLGYNPKMVEAYMEQAGADPRQIIDVSQLDEYRKWIKWRANHFTQVLRDLKEQLEPIRKESGRAIPVAVRIPSAGLFYNMAEGIDVEQWLREGLVDQLQLDPLDKRAGHGSHDVRPYVELGRKYGVPIIGGIGSMWAWSERSYVPAMYRALGLLEAGVDGIEIYEANAFAECTAYRWILPLFGNEDKLRSFLAESNIEACYPVSASSTMFGHDNHSAWYRTAEGLPYL